MHLIIILLIYLLYDRQQYNSILTTRYEGFRNRLKSRKDKAKDKEILILNI